MRPQWRNSNLGFSTQEEGIGPLPQLWKWPFALRSSLGEVRTTKNLQELLDSIDIAKKYAGIRIEDLYNTMLRTGWTLGSPQLMRVLQWAIRAYHRPTVRLLEQHWKATQPDMVVSFVPHFNRALGESLGRALPDRPFVTILTDIADYPPHFWIEKQLQYFICGFPDRRMFAFQARITWGMPKTEYSASLE